MSFVLGRRPARPNIFMFITDDHAVDTLPYMRVGAGGVHGHIADQGMTFDNAFIVVSQCQPSRASLFTGQHAHNHGVYDNTLGSYNALLATDLLPVCLQRAGWRTAMFGKYLNNYDAANPPVTGWNKWCVLEGNYYNYSLNIDGTEVFFGDSPPVDYSLDVLGEQMRQYILSQAASDVPLFMVYGCPAPHDPFTPSLTHEGYFAGATAPQALSFNEVDVSDKPAHIAGLPTLSVQTQAWIDETWRGQLETLLSVNDNINTIVETLDSIGKLEDTYFIFTSDNGFMRGHHRLPYNKQVPYEASVRVPLIIRGPGIPVGVHRNEIVGNIDLTATILQLCNASSNRVLDGKTMYPLLFSRGAVENFRGHLLIEYMIDLLQNYPEGAAPSYTLPRYASLRSSAWCYVEYTGTSEVELYSMSADPDQMVNVQATPAYAAAKAELATLLASAESCVGQDCVI